MGFFLILNMKKDYRVKKNEEFSKIISQKNSLANKSFIIYVAQNKIDHVRLGISVSKKLGNAVVRNKIKRQIRSMAAEIVDLNSTNDYIIIARKDYLLYNYEDNKKSLEKLMIKINKRMGKNVRTR